MEQLNLSYQDVVDAKERIQNQIYRTPLLFSNTLSDALHCKVYLKPEMLQITGSFKLRGALNKMLQLTEEERKRGIICSSSGNHGKACAFLGKLTGTKVIVVLPDDTPTAKSNAIKELGGEVIFGPRLYSDRWDMVRSEQAKHGYTILHGYEDYDVMAGQGTLALEVLEDFPSIDTFIVPIGGGGLISGVATAVKGTNPSIKVIGVQAKNSDAYVESRKAGKPVEAPCLDSLADGLGCRRPGINPYPIVEKYVDDIYGVTEDSIAKATMLVARDAKLVAEPSSCVGIAAILDGEYTPAPDEKICFVLTSGNWDIDKLGKLYAKYDAK